MTTHPKPTLLGSATGLGATLGSLAGLPVGAAMAETSTPAFFETLTEHPYALVSASGAQSAALLVAGPLGGALLGALLGHVSWGGRLEEWAMAERARRKITEIHQQWGKDFNLQLITTLCVPSHTKWAAGRAEEAFWRAEVLRVRAAVPAAAEGTQGSSGAAPQLSFEDKSSWRAEMSISGFDASTYLGIVVIAIIPALFIVAVVLDASAKAARERRAASPLHSSTELE